MKLLTTFTIAGPGRLPGKIRWTHKRGTPTKTETDYKAARDRVRALTLKACEGLPHPIPPCRLGVAWYLDPVKDGPNCGELPEGGCADYDNLCGTILDAIQGCAWCKKYAKGKGKCRCPKPLRVLRDDSPRWYRGHGAVIEDGVESMDGVFLSDDRGERIVVTLWAVDSATRAA